MRRLDDTPIDPSVAAALDAIDATLAGDPVDPQYAELAELALLLSAGRPTMPAAFADELDVRVARRFRAAPSSEVASGAAPRRPWRARLWPAAGAAGLALASGVAVVIGLSAAIGSGGSGAVSYSSTSAAASGGVASTAAATTAHRSAAGTATESLPSSAKSPTYGPATAAVSPAPAPPSNGRKVIQSAQLSLTAPASRIDDVAQEVFNVVGAQNGFVNNSTITQTGGPDGYAQFQLSVPSSHLSQAMTQLSELRYARVAARTDTTQDVNNQYLGDTGKLAQDQALRTSLLKQLANATTQTEIDSIQQQLNDVNAAIANDQRVLNTLTHQINYSQISVSINAGAIPVPVAHPTRGFTLGKAAHDAGRVLTVAAGVALIALAALVPVALALAVIWWIGYAVRRRRREQALDAA